MPANTNVRPAPPRPSVPHLGIGLLGYGFMGKTHSNAYRTIPYIFWPPSAEVDLVAVCGRREGLVAEAAARYGYREYYTDWRDLVSDDRIQVIDNVGPPELHAEPTIAAVRAGKHAICEKPLAMNAAEAKRMWEAAEEANVKHMCGFNYRFVPAVRLAREVIQRGLLGRIYHFRARYLQESAHTPGVAWPLGMGQAGALLILGCHILDVGRFLVGEVARVQAQMTTFSRQRAHPTEPGRTVEIVADEAVQSLLEFEGGATGSIEAAFTCTGRKNQQTWEVNGEQGSLWFDLEDLNRLHVHLDGDTGDVADLAGFRDVLVSESHHPYYQVWWPHGHILGWEHAHINEIAHFLCAVATNQPVGPAGATFEDGYRAAAICDAVVESARSGRQVAVSY